MLIEMVCEYSQNRSFEPSVTEPAEVTNTRQNINRKKRNKVRNWFKNANFALNKNL